MARIKIRYFVEKRQGDHALFYWQPSRSLRAQGWFPRRLARGTNDYLDAIKEAESLNVELDAWRKDQIVELPPQDSTLPWLIRRYEQEPSFKELALSTQRGYGQCLRLIEQWSRDAGSPPLKTLTRRAVKEFYRAMSARRHKANAVMRVLRLLLNFAIDEGLIDKNPAERLRLVGTPPRSAVWSDDDIQAFVKTALEAGRPSLALAVLLGANIGQREGDILRLSWTQYERAEIELRQQKTGKFLRVPVTEVLKRALDGTPRVSTQIVVNETTGAPYKADNFRHLFREIADGAGLKELRFMDLRRTAAVRLAEAGCTAIEIAAITGHDIDTTQRILEVYVPRNTQMARNAIVKLETNKRSSKLEG